MAYTFDHWLETESATLATDNESGVGVFEVSDLEFEMRIEPYVFSDKLRIRISDANVNFNDHVMTLRSASDNKFDDLYR